MRKKLIMSCMAITAFAAFVIAPAASASPVWTDATGIVAKGAKIITTIKENTNVVFTGAVTVTCSKSVLKGEVTKNESNVIESKVPAGSASFTGTSGTGTECSSNLFGAPTLVTVNSALCLTVKAVPADTVTITGCGANVVFTLNLTGNGPCKYSTASVSGTFTTGSALTTVSEQEYKLVEGGFFCPGSGKLDMNEEHYTEIGGKESGTALVRS